MEFLQVALTVYSRTNNSDGIHALFRIVGDFGAGRSDVEFFTKQILERRTGPSTGLTASMAATIVDHAEMVELLLKYGPPTDAVDQHNKKALDYAKNVAVRWLLEPQSRPPTLPVYPMRGLVDHRNEKNIIRDEESPSEWRTPSAPKPNNHFDQ